MRKTVLAAAMVLMLGGCVSAAAHRDAVTNPVNDRLTVGTVQREIKVGMASSEVVEILGAPNMVTTDDHRREVWVYDKIATDVAVSASELSIGGIGGAAGGVGAVGILGGYNAGAGASSTSQRTLTVVVKFDERQRVRDFSYRTSSF